MEARTINVQVTVPKTYRVDVLQKQLTAYAEKLVASTKPSTRKKRHYRHETLCGIFNSKVEEEQLVDDYLKEKFDI